MPSVVYKEWLPDQPDLGNPGLTVATNVIPFDEHYKPYAPLTAGAAAALAQEVRGAHPYATTAGGTAAGFSTYGLLVGTPTDLLRISTNGLTFNSIRSATYNGTLGSGYFWDFAQFDNILIATNKTDNPQQYTIGAAAASTLGSTTGNAPLAQQVGVIGRFVMFGNLATGATGFHSVQWSGIDRPTSYPTPNSSTATAQQSGLQIMPATGGTVTGIAEGDQWGIIFQRARITRVSYAGPPVVFQFDPIEIGRGCFYPNSIQQVKGLTYFASGLGFFVTDGVSVEPIGAGQVDQYFSSFLGNNPATAVTSAIDYENKCVMWSLNGVRIFYYNYERKRWTVVSENVEWLVSGIQRS